MKLFRPLRGPLIFTYPAIRMSKYEWSQKPRWEKTLVAFSSSALIVGFLILSAWPPHGWLTFLSWVGLTIFLTFVCLIGSRLFQALDIPYSRNYTHRFYSQSA